MGAGLAAFDMTAQRPHGTSPWAEGPRSTALDRTHHLQLVEAHMPAVGLTPSRTVIAENVRDLQSWSSHGRGATASAAPRCVASHACGAARSGHRAGSRSWRSARSQRGCSGPSSPASRDRAAPGSRECRCRAQADGSRSCGEAYAERAFLRSPAAFAACLNSRANWRVVSGRGLRRPGNSQRCSGARPASYAVGRAFHHCRNRSRTSAGSITERSDFVHWHNPAAPERSQPVRLLG